MSDFLFEIHTEAGVPHVETWEFTPREEILTRVANHFNRDLRELHVVVVQDDELLEMNKRYLGHNYFTDVLTFDYSVDGIQGEAYCSYERIKENAGQFNVSFEEEFHRVLIHAVLHLCGVKDETEEQKQEMRRYENLFLENKDVPRGTKGGE